MFRVSFSQTAIDALRYERFHHPHPRVQQKMWALWLEACEIPRHEICRLMDISDNTLRAYLKQFADGGVDALKIVPFQGTVSELDDWSSTLEAHFREHPPASATQARAEIIRLTGVERCPTQVREFMNRLGMKFRKVAAVPAKANPEVQQAFKKKSWSLGWNKPRPAIELSIL